MKPHHSALTALGMSRRLALVGRTALAGSLFALVANPASAQNGCVSDDGSYIACSATPDNYSDGIQYIFDPAEKSLFVLELLPGADIAARTADGVYLVNLNGEADILGRDSLLTTDGDGHAGLVIHAYGGGASAGMGSVSTAGDHAAGIVVSTAGAFDADDPFSDVIGTINIDSDVVTTRGSDSSGIVTLAGGGSLTLTQIHSNSISTSGNASHGIDATAEAGGIDIVLGGGTPGLIATSGNNSDGIRTYADQLDAITRIKGDDISTRGTDAMGVNVFANGLANIAIGKVTTLGTGSVGIQSIALFGTNAVQASSVSTIGDMAAGIATQTITGATRITSDSVETAGNGSNGILALSSRGDIVVSANTIRTYGDAAEGIAAVSDFATASASIGHVETEGGAATGIRIGGGRGVTLTADSVITRGDGAAGLILNTGYSAPGDTFAFGSIAARIGTVSTSGFESTGVFVNSVDALDLVIGKVTTSGENAAGVVANTGVANGKIRVDEATTTGQFSVGVSVGHIGRIGSTHLDVSVGSASTAGDLSDALNVYAGASDAHIVVDKSISTTGSSSNGVAVTGLATTFEVANSGLISTKGDDSNGMSFKIGNAATVVKAGKIATAGTGAAGIRIVAKDNDNFDLHSAITVQADQVSTTGDNAYGIDIETGREEADSGPISRSILFASNNGPLIEHVKLTTGIVSVVGAGSIGIRTSAYGDAILDTTNTTSAKDAAMVVEALAKVDLTVRGTATGGGTEAVILKGANVMTAITATGSIVGAGDALVVNAVGPFVPVDGGNADDGGIGVRIGAGGNSMINNAGRLTAGTGYAVKALAGQVNLSNSGTLTGAVLFSDGSDLLTNTGTMIATRDSEFGSGEDRFVNTGTLRLQSNAGPVNVGMNGLERFENAGGIVELRNGFAGDVLTLSGAYAGTGGAVIGLDVGANASDRLVVAGAATGSTRIVLNVESRSARLMTTPMTLVTTGVGSSSDAFSMATMEAGLIRYGMTYDAVSRSYRLATGAGAAVSRLAKTGEAMQSIWRQSADAWSAHMTSLRDARQGGGGLWGQAYGKVDTRHEAGRGSAVAGTVERTDLGYRQDYYGGQVGYDVGGPDDVTFGISGGYLSSKMSLRAGAERVNFDSLNTGAYATVRQGPFFANVLGQYDHYWLVATDRTLAYSATAKADGYGARLELGARAGADGLFVEPVASISWQHVSAGTLGILGQTISGLGGTSVTGRIGARIGGNVDLGGGSHAVFYARGAYVHEFDGRSSALLGSGGTTASVSTERLGDYGTGTVGTNIMTAGPVSGFIEGEVDYGKSVKGGGGRVGLRYRL